jgi:hypothetical protein
MRFFKVVELDWQGMVALFARPPICRVQEKTVKLEILIGLLRDCMGDLMTVLIAE